MRKAIAVLLATSLIVAPIHSYAGPLKKLLIGALAVTAATYALKAKDGSAIKHLDEILKKHGPAIKAVKAARATHEQLKSLQDDFVSLAAADYAADVFLICTTQSPKRCSAALDVGYIGANLYYGENGIFVRVLCSTAATTRANYNNDLLFHLNLKIATMSPSEQESEAGKELQRQLDGVQFEVNVVGDAYLRSQAGELIQPGCKYPLPIKYLAPQLVY